MERLNLKNVLSIMGHDPGERLEGMQVDRQHMASGTGAAAVIELGKMVHKQITEALDLIDGIILRTQLQHPGETGETRRLTLDELAPIMTRSLALVGNWTAISVTTDASFDFTWKGDTSLFAFLVRDAFSDLFHSLRSGAVAAKLRQQGDSLAVEIEVETEGRSLYGEQNVFTMAGQPQTNLNQWRSILEAHRGSWNVEQTLSGGILTLLLPPVEAEEAEIITLEGLRG